MANTDTPFGLRLEQSSVSAGIKTTRVLFDADDTTATFVGDALTVDQTNGGDGETLAMVQAAAGGNVDGVLIGIEATDSSTSRKKYRVASTKTYGLAIVAGIKNAVFLCQEDSVGGALTADDVGKYCDLVVGSGDTTTGISAMEIDSSSAGTADGQVVLLGPADIKGNAIGNNCIWRVMINESKFS